MRWPDAKRTHESLRSPAVSGLRRQDDEADIRAANGPEGEPRTRRVMLMHSFAHSASCARASRYPASPAMLVQEHRGHLS